MLDRFPKYCSSKAIYCYLITLILASVVFMNYAMPLQFMLFGLGSVLLFFLISPHLTKEWRKCNVKTFTNRLFFTALAFRIVYVIFIYYYYIEMTGIPHAFHPGDELVYQALGEVWRTRGFEDMKIEMQFMDFSDSGYSWWLGLEYLLLGTHVLTARIIKCFLDAFSCLLMYNLAKRNFGESVGRMTAIFCMLMPNMWFYCGVTLKETEMAFMTILFAERADYALHSPKITFQNILLPGVLILAMFTFRTALAAVMAAALVGALVLSSGKQLKTWKKILYCALFGVWMFFTVGAEIVQETQQLWEGRETNQTVGYEWRSNREGGNTFAKYATATVLAPMIFTIPFSSMVEVPNQENQMMMHGANFIKNIMSGFVIFALITLLVSGKWRRHVLPIAVTCGYLVVLVYSNFAHSERFHFPILAFELMFAAYGVALMTNKQKRWFNLWLIAMCLANIAWAWFKLAGRGYEI